MSLWSAVAGIWRRAAGKQPLTRANQARAGELDDWRQAIARYADNALSASE